MRFEFTKMQALGNDYIFINGFKYPEILKTASELSVRLSDRHFGIGGDGIIFLLPSQKADLGMRIFNSDGSEAEMCGNGIRQLALYAISNRIISTLNMKIETSAGIKYIEEIKTNDNTFAVRVNMGKPVLEPKKIPVIAELNTGGFAKIVLGVIDKKMEFTVVSMGNPHAVTYVDNLNLFDIKKYGEFIENMTAVFPQKTNAEFIEVISDKEIKMRVWERGSGETLACGTGACASVVSCVLNGLTKRDVLVNLPGGILNVEWSNDGNVYMTGGAEKVFDGTINIAT